MITFRKLEFIDKCAEIIYGDMKIGVMNRIGKFYYVRILGEDFQIPIKKKKMLKDIISSIYKELSRINYVNSCHGKISKSLLNNVQPPKEMKYKGIKNLEVLE